MISLLGASCLAISTLPTAVMWWRYRLLKDTIHMTTLAELQALNTTAQELLASFQAIQTSNTQAVADAVAEGAKNLADANAASALALAAAEANATPDPAIEAEVVKLTGTLGELQTAMAPAPPADAGAPAADPTAPVDPSNPAPVIPALATTGS